MVGLNTARLMTGKEAEGWPIHAEENSGILEIGKNITQEFNRGEISPVEIFQADNGRASLSKGSKDFVNSLMKPCFPELRTYSFNLRIAEGIEAPYIGNQILPVTDEIFCS